MKKILLALAFSLVAAAAYSQLSFTVDGICYTTTGVNTVKIGSGGSYSGSIDIPSTVNFSNVAYTVVAIGDNAFYDCRNLTSVNIPSTVTSLGDNAFFLCQGLTVLNIPSSVTSIGKSAFFLCSGLTSITIPSSITTIGDNAFSYCSGTDSINIPSSITSIGYEAFRSCSGLFNVDSNNTNFSSKDGVLYNKNATLLLYCPTTFQNSFTIPSSVTSIGNYAFARCIGLTSINIPASVTSIGNEAFSECSGLTFMNIPSSISTLGVYVFNSCTGLTSINIPSSVTAIGYGTFFQCTGLTSIYLPSSVTEIGDVAFLGCSGLTSINIPTSITSIAYAAFGSCSSLTSINIPISVTSLKENAFINCTGLTQIMVNSTTPPIVGISAFKGINKSNCTLFVPMGSFADYKGALQWNDFVNIVEFDPTGVRTIQNSNIQLYPNPTSTFLNLFFGEDNAPKILKIYNSIGQKVYDSKVSDSQFQMDVSAYSSGLYFIIGEDKNGQTLRQGRFIKE